MKGATRWSRILVIVGLVAMLIGAIDPLEGSLVILPGTGMVALGALLGNSRHRKLLYRRFHDHLPYRRCRDETMWSRRRVVVVEIEQPGVRGQDEVVLPVRGAGRGGVRVRVEG